MDSPALKSVSDWYVYLIRDRNNSLYCGISTDVARRFSQHSTGKGAKALKGKGPLELVWSEKVGASRGLALKVEYKVKRLKKTQKEQLIKQQKDLAELVDVNLTIAA
ncbi:GIY-YIG nuclease family protein [Vibrio japonicus]|uniref:GIY-YIG nuclease family protein n=1 Tax=Vibrio japonicus TaxID=1824638 RepID=A0ABY5LP76_9VIBR|nr:GIY-YIG nuclease family protein [Vibrio japonicus]UUM32613.1 GIY-YIG nuclease family protein [Vibrio japonicus]